MHEFDYLINTLVDGSDPFTDVTYHSKLLQDFTGKKLGTLVREKTFYIGWGFSYQESSHSNMMTYGPRLWTYGPSLWTPSLWTIS